jgi:hypothetical protein
VLLDSSGMPRTALQWASLDGDALRVRWLLSSGENPNADDYGPGAQVSRLAAWLKQLHESSLATGEIDGHCRP